MVGCDATVDAYALSSDFDQRFPAPERSNNPAQIGVDTREERFAARVAQAEPHDGRSTMEQQVDGEVFVLRDDGCSHRFGVGANGRLGSRQEPAVSHVLAHVTGRCDTTSEGRRELSVDDEAH